MKSQLRHAGVKQCFTPACRSEAVLHSHRTPRRHRDHRDIGSDPASRTEQCP